MPFVRTSRKSSDLLQFPMGGSKRDSAAPPEPSPPKQVTISDEARNDAPPTKESMTVEELQAALDVPDSDSPKEESSRRKSAYDPNGPVEAVALDDDVQFWTTFIDLKTLGKGHFAKVKEVQHAHTCEHFAVKILDKTLSDHDIEDMVREFQMLRTLRHPNIIRLYGAYETPRKLYLVTELAGGGELMKRLPESTRVYSEEMVRTCAPRAANRPRGAPSPQLKRSRSKSFMIRRFL